MIVPQTVINKIHKVEFTQFEPLSTTTLWAYPVGNSYDYRIFLAGQWTSVADDADSNLAELIQRAELAIKAAVAATEGAEAVNAALTGNVLTITDREGNTTSLNLSEIGGGYEPPAGGIPKTDLAADVQTSLGKADTALQSFTESDPTVPSWAKQSSKPSYSYSEITNTPTDLAHIGDTQGSATIANFDPETDTVHIAAQTLGSSAQAQVRTNIGAQEALVSGTNIKTINNESLLGSGNISVAAELPSNTAYLSNDSGDGIVPDDGIKAVTVTSAAAITISPDVVTVIDGAVGASVFTLQVPNDNLAHVWDILFTSAASGIPSFVMSDSSSIKYPSGYSVGASKAVEVSIIGVGETYYLRYGEFA